VVHNAAQQEERGIAVDAEKALELSGEIGALPVLDQCRGAHGRGRAGFIAQGMPCIEQRNAESFRDRLLIEGKSDIDGEASLLDDIIRREARHQLLQPERGDLGAIGVRIETETAGGGQPRARQGREIRSLGSDALGVCLIRGSERNDEFGQVRRPFRQALWGS
jgi:hypothetical protein